VAHVPYVAIHGTHSNFFFGNHLFEAQRQKGEKTHVPVNGKEIVSIDENEKMKKK
jgi:hypothetical protein